MSEPARELLRPRPLQPGDLVVIASLSAPLLPEYEANVEHTERLLERMGFRVRRAPLLQAGSRDIPVLGNVEIGHAGPNLPMPVGTRVRLDAGDRSLSLLEAAVGTSSTAR